jgi:hypothetical protein
MAEPEKRVLKINPDLFSFSNNTTRRKGGKQKEMGKIKLKSDIQRREPRNNESLKKKSLLKMIRNQQNEMYKKLFDKKNETQFEKPKDMDKFDSDFKEAQKYLENLTKEKESKIQNKNYTLKNNRPNQTLNSLFFENMNMPVINNPPIFTAPPNTNNLIHPMPRPIPAPALAPIQFQRPEYGCLKNGSLPTFRNYMTNKTQKVYPSMSAGQQQLHNQQNKIDEILSKTPFEEKLDEELNRISEIRQTAERLKLKDMRPKQIRQKRIKRRTYKIGKSKESPQISVLVSNRTIRNNVSTKSQLLKQVSMQDIKKYLIKRGLIKVGSTAPNDVLRKMYESAIMIGGDVQNHNPDNLLFNFIHSTDN